MSSKPLTLLNRYKFTLIYSVVFWLLGGVVLAVPFAVCGVLVDWLLSKRWEHTIYSNAKYYLSIPILLLLMYQPLILAIIDPDTNSGLIYNWIIWTQPFADKMAAYFPIIDNYSRQMPEKGGGWLVPAMRHYVAVCWLFNLVLLPLAIIDAVRFLILVHRHNFYIYTKPENVHKWLRKVVEQNPGVYDPGKPRRPIWLLAILTTVLCLLYGPLFFLGLKYGYLGSQNLEAGRYFSQAVSFPSLAFAQTGLVWYFLPFFYLLFGRRFLVYRAKKSLGTTETTSFIQGE